MLTYTGSLARRFLYRKALESYALGGHSGTLAQPIVP
jgi:hypothetical protein